MRVLGWITFALGLWLVFAGFSVARGGGAVMSVDIILGIIIAALSYAAMRQSSAPLSWGVAIAGLLTLLSPAAINHVAVPGSRGNDIVIGVIVLILGAASALYYQTPEKMRT
jgi:hypothetical protein